MTIFFYK